MPTPSIRHGSRLWPYGLLLGLVLAFMGESLFGQRIFFLRDTFTTLPSFVQRASAALKTDEWMPWWNPFAGFGKPYIADPQQGFFYPPNWIHYWLPPARAVAAESALHLFIAAASTFALARHWKFTTAPALLMAVCFAFSTTLVSAMEFRAQFATMAWGPSMLLLASVLVERGRNAGPAPGWRRRFRDQAGVLLLLACVISLQYLAGYPQMMLYAMMLTVGFIAARCAWLRDFRLFAASAAGFGIAGICALGLSMVQFLPSWEFIRLSERSKLIDPELNMASVHPSHWLTLALPFLDGTPGYPNAFWGRTLFEYWVGACYIGVIPLLLLGFAPLSLREERHRFLRWFFLIVAAGALLLAAGKYAPAYMWLYDHLPGFGHFRWPGKFLLLLLYAVVFLAGLGFQSLLEGLPRFRRTAALIGAALGLLLIVLVAAARQSPAIWSWLTDGRFIDTAAHRAGAWRDLLEMAAFAGSGAAAIGACLRPQADGRLAASLLVGLCCANLFVVSRRIHPLTVPATYALAPSFRPRQAPDFSSRIYSPNGAAVGQYLYGDGDSRHYQWAREIGAEDSYQLAGLCHTYQSGIKLQSWQEIFAWLRTLPPEQAGRIADVANIRYVVESPAFPSALWGGSPLRFRVRDRPTALPRAHLIDRWAFAENRGQAMKLFFSPSFDYRRSAVVEAPPGEPGVQPEPPAPAAPSAGAVRDLAYKWNSVTLRATAQNRCLLVLSDAWFPGWIARVDGVAKPIYRANLDFRGVMLDPGEHEIIFSYRPACIPIGLSVSVLFAVGMGAVGWLWWRGLPRTS